MCLSNGPETSSPAPWRREGARANSVTRRGPSMTPKGRIVNGGGEGWNGELRTKIWKWRYVGGVGTLRCLNVLLSSTEASRAGVCLAHQVSCFTALRAWSGARCQAGVLGLLVVSVTRAELEGQMGATAWEAEHFGPEAMTGIQQGSNMIGCLYVPNPS